MKLLRTPPRKRLLKTLAAARQRTGLTLPQLAEQVAARTGFIESYERGNDLRALISARSRFEQKEK